MAALRTRNGDIDHPEDLLAVGRTSVLRPCEDGTDRHDIRQGMIITLPELIWRFGREFTAMEIMHWWSRSQKLAVKREWPWGTKDVFGSMLAMGSS